MSAVAASEVSLARLYVMRAMFLVMIAPPFPSLRHLVWHDSMNRGIFASFLGALWFLSVLGVRTPLKIVPILLFEFSWKTVWLLCFGLPQYLAGTGSPKIGEDIVLIGGGPLLFGLIIPWGYVWRHYVKAPGDRWR